MTAPIAAMSYVLPSYPRMFTLLLFDMFFLLSYPFYYSLSLLFPFPRLVVCQFILHSFILVDILAPTLTPLFLINSHSIYSSSVEPRSALISFALAVILFIDIHIFCLVQRKGRPPSFALHDLITQLTLDAASKPLIRA